MGCPVWLRAQPGEMTVPERWGRAFKGRGEPQGFPRAGRKLEGGEQREAWRSPWKMTWALEGRSGPKGQREVSLGALGSFPGPMGRGLPGSSLFLEPHRSLPTPHVQMTHRCWG